MYNKFKDDAGALMIKTIKIPYSFSFFRWQKEERKGEEIFAKVYLTERKNYKNKMKRRSSLSVVFLNHFDTKRNFIK